MKKEPKYTTSNLDNEKYKDFSVAKQRAKNYMRLKDGYIEPKDVVLGDKTSLDAQMLDKLEPKQETLEEAAERYAEIYRCPATNDNEYCRHDIISAFNKGAKWQQKNSNINALDFEIDALKREIKVLKHQQERKERSYSEEEVLVLLQKYATQDNKYVAEFPILEWFEQFKKK